jgi:hypothetical protein
LGGDGTRDLLDQYGSDAIHTSDPPQAGDRFLDRLFAAAQAHEGVVRSGYRASACAAWRSENLPARAPYTEVIG